MPSQPVRLYLDKRKRERQRERDRDDDDDDDDGDDVISYYTVIKIYAQVSFLTSLSEGVREKGEGTERVKNRRGRRAGTKVGKVKREKGEEEREEG